VLSIYTHYFAVFAILSNWFFLLWLSCCGKSQRNYVMHPYWWLANVVVFISYVPWGLSLLQLVQSFDLIGGKGVFNWIPNMSWQTVPSLFWSFITLHDVHATGVVGSWLLALLMLLLSGFVVFRDRNPFALGMLVVAYGWVPIALASVISIVVPVLTTRYLAFCAMALPMIFSVAMAYSNWRHTVVAVVVILLIQAPGVSSVYQQSDDLNFSRSSQDFPMKRVAEKLKNRLFQG